MTVNRILFATLTVTTVGVGATIASAEADGRADPAVHAGATLLDASGAEVGTVRLTEDATGSLHVNVKVAGMSPGEHGIHIHAVGSCTPSFAAAGGHHNPLGQLHGAHAGDLPNLSVNVAGRGMLDSTTDAATLSSGPVSVFDADGASIVVHAAPDDFVGQPAGNSGARIACGVVTAG
jgi:superoxide dismutase, Cu-Zn family